MANVIETRIFTYGGISRMRDSVPQYRVIAVDTVPAGASVTTYAPHDWIDGIPATGAAASNPVVTPLTQAPAGGN